MQGASCLVEANKRQMGQVEDQIEALDKALYQLEEQLTRLEGRLTCVTRNTDCCPGAECEPPEQTLVPVAHRVRDAKKRVYAVNNRMDELFSRIEL